MIMRPYSEQVFVDHMTDYGSWKVRAQRAAADACRLAETGVRPAIVPEIWGETKPALLAHFLDKCAYCETPIIRFWGDVEHYRPKGKVTGEEGHPGYYWLAWDTRNLLPSCQFCNQGHGKMNQFPVEGRRYWRTHSIISCEVPLLINPYFDNPEDYLYFPFNKKRLMPRGTVEAKGGDPRGKHSIKVYNLNEERLVDARKSSQENAIDSFIKADNRGKGKAYMRSIKDDRKPYAAARLAAIRAWIDCDNERRTKLKLEV